MTPQRVTLITLGVADLAAARHGARGGLALAREHARQRGLPGAVAAHEAHPVARAHPEGGALEQQPRASAQLDALGGDGHKTKILDAPEHSPNQPRPSPPGEACGRAPR